MYSERASLDTFYEVGIVNPGTTRQFVKAIEKDQPE